MGSCADVLICRIAVWMIPWVINLLNSHGYSLWHKPLISPRRVGSEAQSEQRKARSEIIPLISSLSDSPTPKTAQDCPRQGQCHSGPAWHATTRRYRFCTTTLLFYCGTNASTSRWVKSSRPCLPVSPAGLQLGSSYLFPIFPMMQT